MFNLKHFAGLLEIKRLDYALGNPMTEESKKFIAKLVEEVVPSTSSEELEDEVDVNLQGVLDDVFEEVILPTSQAIDTDLNGGKLYW